MNARLNKAAMSIGQKMYGGAKSEEGAAGATGGSADSGSTGSGETKANEAEFEKKDEKK